MAKAFGPAFKAPCPARPRSLFAEAGAGSAGRKCGALLRNARGRSGRAREPRRNLSSGWMGETVAGGRSHGGIHDFARRPSSRAGVYAGTSVRIPPAGQGRLRDLGLGKTVEGVRIHAPTMRIGILRTRRVFRSPIPAGAV